jgi:hypothetical protein
MDKEDERGEVGEAGTKVQGKKRKRKMKKKENEGEVEEL